MTLSSYAMAEIAPLVRRPVRVEPEQLYREIGVRSFGKGIFHKPPCTSLEIGDKKVFAVEPGDLLFNIVFAWEGAVAVAAEGERGMIGSHRFLTCVPEPNRALARYLYWYFVHERGLRQLQLASPGGAGRNRTLGIDKLAAIIVDLPAIAEQRKVVERLDRAVAKMAALQHTRDTAQTEITAGLKAAFQKVVGGAPKTHMSDVAPLVRRPVAVSPDGIYPELGVRSFGKGTFHKPSLSGLEVGNKRLFEIHSGDLVFNIVFAWEGAVAVASAADHGRVGSHRFLTCVPDPLQATSNFLRFYFLTPEGIQQLGIASPGGAGRNRTLGLKALEAIRVPVPSLDAQIWFDSLQRKAADIFVAQSDVAAELDHLMPALLDQAFG
ncbi:restriction endonuclease subunit S [Mesorhizobium sp. M5C.F.Ca.IN.020.14.1.1]|nr:restriction endonuclease subunit S [Mesorhizobium sp. M5C.F.Ca.IN.020.14.1.1]